MSDAIRQKHTGKKGIVQNFAEAYLILIIFPLAIPSIAPQLWGDILTEEITRCTEYKLRIKKFMEAKFKLTKFKSQEVNLSGFETKETMKNVLNYFALLLNY